MKFNIEAAFNEQGIPTDPVVTNEYYNLDFESDTSPEPRSSEKYSNFSQTRNSLSRTVVPSNRRHVPASAVPERKTKNTRNTASANQRDTKNLMASKTFSNSKPSGSSATRIEYEKLIDIKNNVLEKNSNIESSLV